MIIESIQIGPLPTNCYFLTDEKSGETAVIDPGYVEKDLTDMVEQKNIKLILITHGHFDHITGVAKVKEMCPQAKIMIEEDDSDAADNIELNLSTMAMMKGITHFDIDRKLKDGDSIQLGSLNIRVMHTPGHTKGGCCYIVENTIFTGDTIMRGTVGRTDFYSGSYDEILKSANKIKNLEGEYRLLPGHESESTLSWERKNNPYMNME